MENHAKRQALAYRLATHQPDRHHRRFYHSVWFGAFARRDFQFPAYSSTLAERFTQLVESFQSGTLAMAALPLSFILALGSARYKVWWMLPLLGSLPV